MKRLAIFCDGTWNRPDAAFPTNVFKLHKATRLTSMDGISQLPKYIPGVGTGFGMSGLQARWDRFRGGLFGAGVTRNIMVAYWIERDEGVRIGIPFRFWPCESC